MNFKYSWILNEYGVSVESFCSVGHDHLDRNKVYLINNKFILKIYGKFINWKRELESLLLIKDSAFQVPLVLDYGITKENEPWTLMNKISGKILSKIELKFDYSKLKDLYYDIGSYQARFHKALADKHSGNWATTTSKFTSHQDYFDYEILKNRRLAEQVLSKAYPEQALFLEAYKKMKRLESAILGDLKISLCHNDLSARNIIVKDNLDSLKLTGFIDFELSHTSNIENDIVKMLIKTHKKDLSKHYFEGYLSENTEVFIISERKEYYVLVACFDICRWARKLDRAYFDDAIEIIKLILKGNVDKVFMDK
ncbi:MAG TPA: aminoglycoside phosphotransferase family protein [Clostridia bacterium]|nr:aminoglycoside phosphotransferase family protein [Clostridia bacterium]